MLSLCYSCTADDFHIQRCGVVCKGAQCSSWHKGFHSSSCTSSFIQIMYKSRESRKIFLSLRHAVDLFKDD